jgi:hypothetical protein
MWCPQRYSLPIIAAIANDECNAFINAIIVGTMDCLGASVSANVSAHTIAGAIYRAPTTAMADAPPITADVRAAPDAIHCPSIANDERSASQCVAMRKGRPTGCTGTSIGYNAC